jgi:hypothetical protein
MKESDFCDEFLNRDLRYADQCKDAVEGCDWVFNLAVRPPPPGPRGAASRARHRSRAALHRRTWAAWASSSPTTRASCTTRR